MAFKYSERLESRQATKQDLLDIARALGVTQCDALTSVPVLRSLIRARLNHLEYLGVLPVPAS